MTGTASYGLPENVLDLQYMTESARGTFSTGTTAVFIAQSPQLQFGSDLGTFMNYVTGSRDPSNALHSLHTLQLGLVFPTCLSDTMKFFKRGVNLADGIGVTMSMCLRETIGDTAGVHTHNYLKLKNCLIASGAFGCVGAGPVQGQVTIAGNLSSYDNTTPPGWSFVSVPTTAPYLSVSGGVPIIVRDVTAPADYTPDVRSWSVAFNNGLFPIVRTGYDTFGDFIPTKRGIVTSLSCNKKDLNLWGVHNLHDDVNVYISIATGACTWTGIGGLLDPAAHTFSTDSPNIEVYQIVNKTGSLVAS